MADCEAFVVTSPWGGDRCRQDAVAMRLPTDGSSNPLPVCREHLAYFLGESVTV